MVVKKVRTEIMIRLPLLIKKEVEREAGKIGMTVNGFMVMLIQDFFSRARSNKK